MSIVDGSIGKLGREERARVSAAEMKRKSAVDSGEVVVVIGGRADLAPGVRHLLIEALSKRATVTYSLLSTVASKWICCQIAAPDLGFRSIFQEVVERHRAPAPKPLLDIPHADTDVLAEAGASVG